MKQTRLYNVIFPVWLLFLVPVVWLIVIPANLLIDCAVVLVTLFILKHEQKRAVLKQVWWKFWLLGFAADLVGALFLLPAMQLSSILPDPVWELVEPVMYNCWKSPVAFIWTGLAVAVSGLCIYFFDKWVLHSCEHLSGRERHILALTLAIVTAPWTFFIPVY